MVNLLAITACSQDLFAHCIANLCEGRGASAFGPAGTGKTESFKDCSKLLGVHGVVHTATDQADQEDMFNRLTEMA